MEDQLDEKCKVCQYKSAAVLYFGIGVCSGCRAFFLRSMKVGGKKYRCLNNRLCGKSGLVTSNRRVCKSCRLERCIEAGMLKAKIELQSHLEGLKNARDQMKSDNFIIAKRLTASANDPNSQNVLALFSRLRQQFNYERQLFYGPFKDDESVGSSKEVDATRIFYDLLMKVVTPLNEDSGSLFGRMDKTDFKYLVTCDFMSFLTAAEMLITTVRSFGHKTRRIYRLDYSYNVINGEERLYSRWKYIRPYIDDSKNSEFSILKVLVEQRAVMQVILAHLSHLLVDINLDDSELSALLLLLFSREASTQLVKQQESREYLTWLRSRTLNQLAQHIESTGRNVVERMGQIVLLMGEFLEIGRQFRKYMNLTMAATTRQIWPNSESDLYKTRIKYSSENIVP